MPDDAFAFAIPRMRLAYFAKDREILVPRLGAATHLHIVQRGAVGSRVEDPRVEPEPPLGPGECFPVGALSAGGPPTKIYHALEDTFCYQLPRDDGQALVVSVAAPPSDDPQRLSGPRYAALRPAYWGLPPKDKSGPLRRVLVTTGGSVGSPVTALPEATCSLRVGRRAEMATARASQ